MANDLEVIRPAGAVAEYDPQAAIMRLAQSKAIVQHIMKAIMKGPTQANPLGVHYGIIPGTPKLTLLKAGSEIILSTFRISVEPIVEDLSTKDCIRYRVKAVGRTPNGEIVGYGIGECSTDEEKYRWKKPSCDGEFAATDPNRRRSKWGKGTGGKEYTTPQIRTTPADLANTVLKMAKKRAQIDLTLTATGASDVFDQDLEDLQGAMDLPGDRKAAATGGKPEVNEPTGTGNQGTSSATKDPAAKITGGGANYLKNQLDEKKIPVADFCAFLKVATLGDITNGKFNDACAAVKKWEVQP